MHSIPAAEIDFLVKKGMEGLFTGHPFIHEVIIWDKGENKYPDLHVPCPPDQEQQVRCGDQRAAVRIKRFPYCLFRGEDKDRVRQKSFFHLIHKKSQAQDRALHPRDQQGHGPYLAASRMIPIVKPKLYPPEIKKGREIYYTISPASLWFTKQYPKERWIELAGCMDRRSSVYLLGSAKDRPLCEEIIYGSGHPNCHNLAGEISLLESAGLMKGARMNFTNDSAPLHLASAVDAPVTAIYCSTVPEFGFGPLSSDSKVVEISEPLSCRPCGLHGLAGMPGKAFQVRLRHRCKQSNCKALRGISNFQLSLKSNLNLS